MRMVSINWHICIIISCNVSGIWFIDSPRCPVPFPVKPPIFNDNWLTHWCFVRHFWDSLSSRNRNNIAFGEFGILIFSALTKLLFYLTGTECDAIFTCRFKILKVSPSYLIVVLIIFPPLSARSKHIYGLLKVFFTWWISCTFKTTAMYQVVSFFLHFAAALIYLQKTPFLFCVHILTTFIICSTDHIGSAK